jgi:dihydrofolate reductase
MAKRISMIAAVAQNGVMGDADTNKLPWHYPEDFKRFKAVTTAGFEPEVQGTIIMGRKTWESIGSRPLPKRRNIIVSSTMGRLGNDPAKPDVVYVSTLEDAIENGTDNIWICGGSSVYEQSMKYAGLIDLTIVPDAPQLKNPVRFPWINPLLFKLVSEESTSYTKGDITGKLIHVQYERIDDTLEAFTH